MSLHRDSDWEPNRVLRWIRVIAFGLMAVIAIHGTPSALDASPSCFDELIQCHDNADACVADGNQPCFANGFPHCQGVVKCYPAGTSCAPSEPFAEICEVSDSGDPPCC